MTPAATITRRSDARIARMSRTNKAPTLRSGTTQAQIVFEISLRDGNQELSSEGRTPQLSESTVVRIADPRASTSVERGQRASAHGRPSARNGSAGAKNRGP